MVLGIPPLVRALALPLIAALLAYLAHALTRFGGAPADTFFGTDVYQAIKALSLALIVARVLFRREDRLAFGLLALGFALNLAGDVAWGVLYRDNPALIPVPSLCDVLYIASYIPFSAAAALIVRKARTPGAGAGLWLDGVVVALTLTTGVAYLVLPPLLASWRSADIGAIVTNAGYVVGDALVSGTLVASLAFRNWRPDGRSGLLALTFAGWVCADAIYLVQVAENTYVAAGVLDLGWLVSAALASLAAWVPAAEHARDAAPGRLSTLIPSVAGVAAIALLLIDHFTARTVWLAVPVCVIAILIFTRFSLVSAEHHRLIARTRRESLTDPLTGLFNRRRLLEDLERASGSERTLVLFDLDGFKGYNDRFGHPAGDALLVAVAGALARALGDRGVAYRLGGDEFCALVAGADDPSALAHHLAATMSYTTDDVHVGASCGATVIPHGEVPAALALADADALLYANKRARRLSTVAGAPAA